MVHITQIARNYIENTLSAVKAGSVFFGQICTSVVNLAHVSMHASVSIFLLNLEISVEALSVVLYAKWTV